MLSVSFVLAIVALSLPSFVKTAAFSSLLPFRTRVSTLVRALVTVVSLPRVRVVLATATLVILKSILSVSTVRLMLLLAVAFGAAIVSAPVMPDTLRTPSPSNSITLPSASFVVPTVMLFPVKSTPYS